MRWIVGNGKISFWDDIWIGDRPLREMCLDDRGDPLTSVSDMWRDGQWDIPKLHLFQHQHSISHQTIDEIRDIPIFVEERDIPRWNLYRPSNFSLASAWDTVRSQQPVIPVLEDIWAEGLTQSMSIYIWSLLSNRIPMDTKLQWRKISLASKCHCCPRSPNIESLNHLFNKSSGAMAIWREFDGWFEGPNEALRMVDSIPDCLEMWSKRVDQSNKSHLSRIIPCMILWFIHLDRT